jgi:hypothetical protein
LAKEFFNTKFDKLPYEDQKYIQSQIDGSDYVPPPKRIKSDINTENWSYDEVEGKVMDTIESGNISKMEKLRDDLDKLEIDQTKDYTFISNQQDILDESIKEKERYEDTREGFKFNNTDVDGEMNLTKSEIGDAKFHALLKGKAIDYRQKKNSNK